MDLRIAFVQMELHKTRDLHSFFVLEMSIVNLADHIMPKTMVTVDIVPKYLIKLLCRPPIFAHIYERKNQENAHVDDIYGLEILL